MIFSVTHIRAVLEAWQLGRKVDGAIAEQFVASWAKSVPGVAESFSGSPKVAAISARDVTPLRGAAPQAWRVCHRFWMRAR